MIKIIDSRVITEGIAASLQVGRLPILIVRHHGRVYAYGNNCPHLDLPLDQRGAPLMFEQQLRCSNHGATFDCATGICSAGPCQGAALSRINVSEFDGTIWLNDE